MSAAGPEVVAGSVAAATASGFSATSVFFTLLVPALVLYFIYFRISRRHMLELAEKIPGPKGLPIIGNTLELLGSSDSTFFFCTIMITEKRKTKVMKFLILQIFSCSVFSYSHLPQCVREVIRVRPGDQDVDRPQAGRLLD